MTVHSELCMNEPSSPSAQTKLPLRYLQEIIHNRIIQKKSEMHPSHNQAHLESLHTELETLRWVLTQILVLLQRSQAI